MTVKCMFQLDPGSTKLNRINIAVWFINDDDAEIILRRYTKICTFYEFDKRSECFDIGNFCSFSQHSLGSHVRNNCKCVWMESEPVTSSLPVTSNTASIVVAGACGKCWEGEEVKCLKHQKESQLEPQLIRFLSPSCPVTVKILDLLYIKDALR